MGYYDTQHVTPSAGGQPYNVRDILLATQGVTGGLDKLVADAGVDRKAQQQMKANEYVSGLLGKATTDTYKQDLLSAGTMAPYASPELMKQVDTSRLGFQREEDIAHRDKRDVRTDFVSDRSHGLETDKFGFTKDSWNKDFAFKSDKDARDFLENQRQFGITNKRMYDLAELTVTSNERLANAQTNALLNKPVSALITTSDGKQVVRDVPYSAVIQGGYKDPKTGKTVSIQSLQNVKDTEAYTGITTTKGAAQKSFASLIGDKPKFEQAMHSAFSAAVHGKDWIAPKISDTKLNEITERAGGVIQASPELQALWNNATTDKQRGQVIMKAQGMIKEPVNVFKRTGGMILNKLLPDEYEVDLTGTTIQDKAAAKNLLR